MATNPSKAAAMPDDLAENSHVDPTDLANSLLTVIGKLYLSARQSDSERRVAGELTNAQYSVLLEVSERGRVRVSELAQAAGVTLPAMSVTVSRLTRRGLLWRPSPTRDRRNSVAALTQYGEWVLNTAMQARHRSLQTRVLGMSRKDQHTLFDAATILRRMFEGHAATASDVGTGLADADGV